VVVFPFVKSESEVELRRDAKEVFFSEFLDLGRQDPDRDVLKFEQVCILWISISAQNFHPTIVDNFLF
jgi:hypothetical protein